MLQQRANSSQAVIQPAQHELNTNQRPCASSNTINSVIERARITIEGLLGKIYLSSGWTCNDQPAYAARPVVPYRLFGSTLGKVFTLACMLIKSHCPDFNDNCLARYEVAMLDRPLLRHKTALLMHALSDIDAIFFGIPSIDSLAINLPISTIR